MRTAAANDSDSSRFDTVLTARAKAAQFRRIWSDMEQPHELAAPGPTRVVHVQLSSGHDATVVFHERPEFAEILASIQPGIEVGLADLLAGIGVAPDDITWTHDQIDRNALAALQNSIAQSVAREPDGGAPLVLTLLAPPSTTTSRTRRRRVLSLSAPLAREEHATAIHEKHYRRLVRFLKAYRFSEDDVEDLAQEAFARFYQSSYATRTDAAWPLLQTVARSILFNKLRAAQSFKRRFVPVDVVVGKNSAELAVVPDYDEHEATVLRRKQLHDAIASLPSGQRQCMQLWLDGFAYGEIARALRVDEQSVMSRLLEAKKQLRDQLGNDPEQSALVSGS
ncbi:MAG TPA: RNA polymerase sigma factor [Thermoanaerobaculia bacterium]|nr:RNA polymerase sigma factor [Thermoanaerobaculia bacterium]